ncbi:flagellar hook-length control protein FliK [Caldinitratiruptor microaerophilus]|uniref:Flagellar hook-length control protein-like C-terminal domain-containing protein n=1 Tax=Caldinitratiruptor microaerophilus TaxID=671077 RepID=A0AA35CHY7_9FIRM|nr:flagellar hook-length control protein FliK [Caldinitratiruptor microaerophilus]BDG59355.1 hypothetical protein caldi_04450 [Caldinitratiruptor microaerophilus]
MSVEALLVALPDAAAAPAPGGRSPAAPAGARSGGDAAGGFRSVLRRSLERGTPAATPDGAAPPDGVPEGGDVPVEGNGDPGGGANPSPVLVMALVPALLAGSPVVPGTNGGVNLAEAVPAEAVATAAPAPGRVPDLLHGGGASAEVGGPLLPTSGPPPDGTPAGAAEGAAPPVASAAGDPPEQAAASPPDAPSVTPEDAARVGSGPHPRFGVPVRTPSSAGPAGDGPAIPAAVPAPGAGGEGHDPADGLRSRTVAPVRDGQVEQAAGTPGVATGRSARGPVEIPAGEPGESAGNVPEPAEAPPGQQLAAPPERPTSRSEPPGVALRPAESTPRATWADEPGGQTSEVRADEAAPGTRVHAGAPPLVGRPEPRPDGTAVAAAPMTWRQALAAADLSGQLAGAVREAHLRAEAGGPAEMRVRLEPPHLGEVTVRLTVHEGVVRAEILVARPEVKAALESQMGDLRQRLEQQGLEVGAFHVGVGGGEAQSRDPGSMPAPRWIGNGRLAAWKEPEPVRSAPDLVASPYSRWRLGHRLDRIV